MSLEKIRTGRAVGSHRAAADLDFDCIVMKSGSHTVAAMEAVGYSATVGVGECREPLAGSSKQTTNQDSVLAVGVPGALPRGVEVQRICSQL